MRLPHIARRRGDPSPELAPPDAFRRYRETYGRSARSAGATRIAARIGRKHCAGRAGRPDGEELLQALDRLPGADCPMSGAIDWLLDRIQPSECTRLIVYCGVTPEALARHLRAKPVPRPDLVNYLNQFTVP